MKAKSLTRLLAAGALVGLGAVHYLPGRLLPFRSKALVSVLVVGALLLVHRNPLRVLAKDAKPVAGNDGKSLARETGT